MQRMGGVPTTGTSASDSLHTCQEEQAGAGSVLYNALVLSNCCYKIQGRVESTSLTREQSRERINTTQWRDGACRS